MYNTQFAKEHEERGGGIYEISGEFHGSRINWKGERGEREALRMARRFVSFSCVFSSFRSQFFESGAMKHETRHRDESPAAR